MPVEERQGLRPVDIKVIVDVTHPLVTSLKLVMTDVDDEGVGPIGEVAQLVMHYFERLRRRSPRYRRR